MKDITTNTTPVFDFGALPISTLVRRNAPVTLFRGIHIHPERKITLGELLSEIETTDITKLNAAQSLLCLYEVYLQKSQESEKASKEAYDQKKKTLNGFLIGNWVQRNDEKSHCLEYVPCLVFDLDGCLSTYDCFLYLQKLRNLDYIFASFPSPSGHGLRIWVWTNATYETHRLVYQQVIEKLCKDLELTTDKKKGTHLDSTCQNESRLFFYVAVDRNNFYVNWESLIFESNWGTESENIEPPQKRSISFGSSKKDLSETVLYMDTLNDSVKIEYIIKMIDMQKPRKLQCFDFGCLCRENNVDFDAAFVTAKQTFYDFEQKNPEKVILNQLTDAYKRTNVCYTDAQFAVLLYQKFGIRFDLQNKNFSLPKKEEKQNGNLDLETKYPNEEFYQRLPISLRNCTSALVNPMDKHVFFWGVLPVLGSICCDVSGLYDDKTIYATYYTYVVATGGAGKGALDYARQIIMGVAQKMAAENEKTTTKKMLFVPTNIGNTQLVQKLNDNEGRGLFFETEGSIVAKMAKSENMDLSDTLRKGFHHEMLLLARKMDKIDIAIHKLRLSVVISGTFSQLLPTIKDGEDGLFSRFNYLYLTGNYAFKNVFNRQKSKEVFSIFKEMSEKMRILYELLQNQYFTFQFTEAQEIEFCKVFVERKAYMMDFFSEKGEVAKEIFSGVMNRIGVMTFRVAMILTVLRYFDEGKLEKTEVVLICNEEDFKTAIVFSELARNNAIAVFNRLPKLKEAQFGEKNNPAERIKKAIELKNQGFSYSEIARILLGDENKKSTVAKWFNK